MGARSVTSRSKSTSSDCSTTCVAMSSRPARCSAVLSLPKVPSTRASMFSRSRNAKRAWNSSRCSAGSTAWNCANAASASATVLRTQQTHWPAASVCAMAATTSAASLVLCTDTLRCTSGRVAISSCASVADSPDGHEMASGYPACVAEGAGSCSPLANAANSPCFMRCTSRCAARFSRAQSAKFTISNTMPRPSVG